MGLLYEKTTLELIYEVLDEGTKAILEAFGEIDQRIDKLTPIDLKRE
ncbi:MAG: hypothetical protein ACK4LA_07205 [Aquificaceae bacterium]